MSTTGNDAKSDRTISAYEKELRTEMAEIRDDITAMTETLSKYGKARAEGLHEQASDWSEDMAKKSRKAVRKLEKRVARLQRETRGKVRENPVPWFLGALGVGLVIATMVGRSDD